MSEPGHQRPAQGQIGKSVTGLEAESTSPESSSTNQIPSLSLLLASYTLYFKLKTFLSKNITTFANI